MLTWAFGTFTPNLLVGFIKGVFWLNCNRCPCIVPNMKGSWIIPIHSFINSLSLSPMGIEPMLLHGPGSMAFESWYGLERPSSGSFSLLVEYPVSHDRCASSWRGPENGLVSWVAGTLARPSMPILAGMPCLCRSGGYGRFFFCTFSILMEPLSSCRCVGLWRRLDTRPCSTLCGSTGPGMPISRHWLPIKDDVLQDSKSKLFKYISLWEEEVVLKGLYWGWAVFFHVGSHPLSFIAWLVPWLWYFGGPMFLWFLLLLHLVTPFYTQSQGLCWLKWLVVLILWPPLL